MKSVIPICHSGIEPSKLPIPLNLLQAAKANEVSSLKSVFHVLATAIGADCPNIDFSTFIKNVIKFENNYTFWDVCNPIFKQLNKLSPNAIEILRSGNEVALYVNVSDRKLISDFDFLEKNNLASIKSNHSIVIDDRGHLSGRVITPLEKLNELFSNPNFIYHNEN